MKEKIIKRVVLSIIFLVAIFVSSHYVNRGSADMTADIGSATLPTISFEINGREMNLLEGYIKDMDLSAIRDTIVPIGNENVKGHVQAYGQTIESMTYTVCSIDGEETLMENTLNEVGQQFSLSVGSVLQDAKEYLLKIDLKFEEKTASYYTRIIKENDLNLSECIDYVENLHTSMIQNINENEIKRMMESNATGDNTTLQHVTIHSNLEHSMWGDLKPEVIGDIRYSIQEAKKAYSSILLRYKVRCVGDNNAEEIHHVQEFFRVSCSDGEVYLLDYDRTLQEEFNPSNVVLSSKGIILGLTTNELEYKSNEAGNIVAFIQNQELWSYSKEEDAFALVFSFAGGEKEDVRHYFDKHSIRILSMEENGNLTFAVNGYMNRGLHEGESGVVIYYYKCAQNIIEEKAFIPSNQSLAAIERKLGEVAYYNDQLDMLYVLAGGTLYQINFALDETKVLLEDLEQIPYVSSADGHLLAYQNKENLAEATVMNFKTDSKQVVNAEEGEILIPLGFVKGDFVYGVARPEDAGTTSSGEMVQPMYKLEIRDAKNQVLKTYQVTGSYVLGIKIDSNMISLERAVLGNGVYTPIAEDYITNNEEKANAVTLQSYWTDLKETQYRLIFDEGIDDKKAVEMKPKQVLFERDTTLAVEKVSEKDYYSVYGLGRLEGIYEKAGEALQMAKKISGVVVSPKHNYVWEDGNRVAWYRNFEMRSFQAQSGESNLAASIRAVLAYEGASVDVSTELISKSALEIMNEYCGGEAVQFSDCSVADVRYLIDKGTPVIALTGSSDAIVLIGYDAVSVTYIEPSIGAIRMKKFAAVDDMIKSSGSTFFAYVK